MVSKKKALAILSAALLCVIPLFAQDVTVEWVKNAPSAKDYPDQDGLILLEKRVLEVGTDGSLTETYTRVFKIFTQVGLSAYADPRFLFWSGREQIKAVRARTFMADGTVVPVPDNGYHDMVWSAVASAPDWLALHQYVVDHTALEKGAVIDLEVRRTGPVALRASGVEPLQTRFPTLQRVFEVRVPQGMHFEYRTWPRDVKPSVSQSGDQKVYTWSLHDLPALPVGSGRGAKTAHGLTVAYSFVSWQTWAKKMREKVSGAEQLGEAAKRSLTELLSGKGRGLTLIRTARDWLEDNVRTVRVDPLLQSAQVRPASRVFETRYGTPLEKAVLLATALRAFEVPAWVALSGPSELVSRQAACPAALTHVWVTAQVDGREVWLDPTRPVRDLGTRLPGDRVLILGDEKYTWKEFPVGDADANHLDLSLKLTVMPCGRVQGEGTAIGTGAYALGFDLMTAAERRSLISDWLATSLGTANVELKDVPLVSDRGAEIGFTFTLKDSLASTGDLRVLTLTGGWPAPSGEKLSGEEPALGAWIELTAPVSVAEEIEVEVPKTWKVRHVPKGWKVQNEVGESRGEVVRLGAGRIKLVRKLEVSEASIPPQEVSGYLSVVNAGGQLSQRTLVFLGRRGSCEDKAAADAGENRRRTGR